MRTTPAKGFTLIELLIVVAIIGLLSSIVLASLSVARERARDTGRLTSLKQVVTAIELYKDNHGNNTPPSNTGDQGCTTYCLTDLANELTPTHIASIPLDPQYGNVPANGYRYCAPATGGEYSLLMWNEATDGWCNVQHGSNISGTACWVTGGVPNHGWCEDEI